MMTAPGTQSSSYLPSRWVLLVLILVLTLFAYLPSLDNDFTNWDDPDYITENNLIHHLSWRNVADSFSTLQFKGNYHPLTIVSTMIEFHLFGKSPGGYHIVSIALHLAVTTMVFFLILGLSADISIAALASLLFGIHPMHVESVAWLSQRKDTLYAFFYLASVLMYLGYLHGRSRRWLLYVGSIVVFIASGLSKGLAVTLPLALLCIDYMKGRLGDRRALVEKIPFFLLALGFGIVAIVAQQSARAIADVDQDGMILKMVFASYGYLNYIVKLLVPIGLSPFYPYPDAGGEVIPWYYWILPLVVAGVAYFVWRARSNKPLVGGLAIFTFTIFPVLQLLQVGNAIMADRYIYIASIGIVYIESVAVVHIYKRFSKSKHSLLIPIAFAGYALWLMALTWNQSNVWQNSITLWTSVLDAHPSVPIALTNRGNAYHLIGEDELAIRDLDAALLVSPGDGYAYYNRAMARNALENTSGALRDYDQALALVRDDAEIVFRRGMLFLNIRRYPEALTDFSEAVRLRENFASAYANRGLVYSARGELPLAIADFSRAIELEPADPTNYFNRANVLASMRQYAGAVSDYSTAIRFNGSDGEAYHHRGLVYALMDDRETACSDFQTASGLRYKPADSALREYCR